MPRKTRRSVSTMARPESRVVSHVPWLGYLLTALLASGLGAALTFFLLRPALLQNTNARRAEAQAALASGNDYEDHQQWPQAIESYTHALADGIDNPDIRTDLGYAYYHAGQPQKALEQYFHAQQQNPQHENSLYNQGSAYALLGNTAQAITIWRTYLQRFPQGQHVAAAQQLIAEVQGHLVPPAGQR